MNTRLIKKIKRSGKQNAIAFYSAKMSKTVISDGHRAYCFFSKLWGPTDAPEWIERAGYDVTKNYGGLDLEDTHGSRVLYLDVNEVRKLANHCRASYSLREIPRPDHDINYTLIDETVIAINAGYLVEAIECLDVPDCGRLRMRMGIADKLVLTYGTDSYILMLCTPNTCKSSIESAIE